MTEQMKGGQTPVQATQSKMLRVPVLQLVMSLELTVNRQVGMGGDDRGLPTHRVELLNISDVFLHDEGRSRHTLARLVGIF